MYFLPLLNPLSARNPHLHKLTQRFSLSSQPPAEHDNGRNYQRTSPSGVSGTDQKPSRPGRQRKPWTQGLAPWLFFQEHNRVLRNSWHVGDTQRPLAKWKESVSTVPEYRFLLTGSLLTATVILTYRLLQSTFPWDIKIPRSVSKPTEGPSPVSSREPSRSNMGMQGQKSSEMWCSSSSRFRRAMMGISCKWLYSMGTWNITVSLSLLSSKAQKAKTSTMISEISL